METVNIHKAKTHLSQLVDRVLAGEEITISKRGKPVARLVPIPPSQPRKPGLLKGQIWMSDDFDAPLPEEELKYWEGRA